MKSVKKLIEYILSIFFTFVFSLLLEYFFWLLLWRVSFTQLCHSECNLHELEGRKTSKLVDIQLLKFFYFRIGFHYFEFVTKVQMNHPCKEAVFVCGWLCVYINESSQLLSFPSCNSFAIGETKSMRACVLSVWLTTLIKCCL